MESSVFDTRPLRPSRTAAALRDRVADAARELSPATVAAALALLVAASAILRTQALGAHYWVDEAITVGIAGHPIGQLHSLLRQDGSPPLYYLLLHFWIALFGTAPTATHVLSLLFALLAVPVACWAAVPLGRRAGLLSALLTAGIPFLTSYAQETRMYALVVLLSLVVTGSFLRAFVDGRRGYLPVFALSLAATLYTHDWGLYLGASSLFAAVICVRARPVAVRRRATIDTALTFVVVAALYAPWLPTLAFQAQHTGAPWAIAPVLWSLTQGLYFIVGDRSAAVALLLAGGAGLIAIYRPSRPGDRTRTALQVLVVLALLTLVFAWVEGKLSPSWTPRYEAVIVGPLAVLFGAGLAKGGRLSLAALILVVGFWVLDGQPTSASAKSNVAAVASVERAALGPHALVLSTQPEQVPTLAYYMPHVHRFGTPLSGATVGDPRVVDWIDALTRFEHSTVAGTLAPLLRGVRPGDPVALVIPLDLPGQSRYLALVNRTSHRWLAVLRGDHAFRFVTSTQRGSAGSSGPVRLYLFRRRVR